MRDAMAGCWRLGLRTTVVFGVMLTLLGATASGASASGLTAYEVDVGASTVTPIDVATGTVGTPISVGSSPLYIAITPNGQTAFVSNNSAGSVTPINLATNTAGTPITVASQPAGIAITPNGQTAYVANGGSNSVTPINVSTLTAGSPITVGSGPLGIAITPNGQTAYVVNQGSNSVTPINLATNTAGTPITVASQPAGIAITPNGQTAYVANQTSNSVTPINLATNTAGTAIPVSGAPRNIAITPNGATAYVTDVSAGSVTPINLATNTAGTPITVGSTPIGIGITPDGSIAYVTNLGSGSVTPINLATNTAGTAISVGGSPYSVAFNSSPTSTAVPTISGTPQQGQNLTASHGSWSGSPTGYQYQWQDCTSSGSGCTAITGATSSSYVLTGSDVGDTVRVLVIAQNAAGSSTATPSAVTAVVTAVPTTTTTTTGTTTSNPTTTSPGTTGTVPSATQADAATLPAATVSAGLQTTSAGRVSVPLQCPQVVAGVCDTSGTLSISLNPGALPGSRAMSRAASTEESVIATFAGIQVQSGQRRLVATNLSPSAIAFLRAHDIYRVRVTLEIATTLSDDQTVNATQHTWLYVSGLTGCHAATGTLSPAGVGALRLQMTRRGAHQTGHYRRTRNGFEHYCIAGGQIRIAYSSHTLAHARHIRFGRVMIALTGNHHYAIHGVRTGMTVTTARKRLHLGRPIVIGKNAWYFIPGKKATRIIKAQHGLVREIGVTARATAHTRTQQHYLLRHLK